MSKTILYYAGAKYQNSINQDDYIKTFDWTEDEYNLDRCTAEVICRTYICKKKLHGITTKTIDIEPKELNQKLNELNADWVQQNFITVFNDIKKYIEKNFDNVLIEIEEAKEVSTERLHEIADDETEREEFINKLFEILAIIHKNNLVHRDIKIENLMYVTRNDVESLVLNDWDASFILQNDMTTGMKYVLPLATFMYAAPEQLDAQMKVGMYTDIWQAGMVAYYLHNGCKFPETYYNIDFEKGASTEIRKGMNRIFKKFRDENCTFPEPENSNDYIRYIISSALNVNPKKRPSAKDILDKLITIKTQPVKAKIPECEDPESDPKEKAERERDRDEEAKREETERKKRREKERKKENLTKFIAGSVSLLVVAFGSMYIGRLKSGTDKTTDTESDSSVSETVSQTKEEHQTTEDETSYVTTEQVTATQDDSTEISVDEEPGNLDYTYVKWVENYRLGDGIYTGGLDENDDVHGKNCTYEKDNGEIYKGDYYHGERYGYGVYENDQLRYDGNWINNMMYDDDCKINYSNGNSYNGGIKENKKNGKGILHVDKESERGYLGVYNGYFVDDDFEGDGIFQYSNGDVFAGEFHEHERWNGIIKYSINGLEKEIKNGKPEQ